MKLLRSKTALPEVRALQLQCVVSDIIRECRGEFVPQHKRALSRAADERRRVTLLGGSREKPGPRLSRCINCDVVFASIGREPFCGAACSVKILNQVKAGARRHVVTSHWETLRKRHAGIYDRPELTPYALGLVSTQEPGEIRDDLLAAASAHNDQRISGLIDVICRCGRKVRDHYDLDLFNPGDVWFLLGSAWAAGHPERPLDHSGLH